MGLSPTKAVGVEAACKLLLLLAGWEATVGIEPVINNYTNYKFCGGKF
mgnify:CR=1 FL=1